mmetsp:Transcript_77691/g.222681  ORF Transcript_77691/g.222681 Transcript_77691/m.222681 type:complete len:298 (+) Transcript_77691:108-1001(+)
MRSNQRLRRQPSLGCGDVHGVRIFIAPGAVARPRTGHLQRPHSASVVPASRCGGAAGGRGLDEPPSLVETLQLAVKQAKSAGFGIRDSEFRRAENLIREEQARDELAAAIVTRKPAALRATITKAQKLRGIDKAEIEPALQLLLQVEATDLVAKALREGDIGMLRIAIDRSKAAGIDQECIDQVEIILKQIKGRQLLNTALELRRSDLIKLALREVKHSHLEEKEIAAAKDLLNELSLSRGKRPSSAQNHQQRRPSSVPAHGVRKSAASGALEPFGGSRNATPAGKLLQDPRRKSAT